MSPWVSGLRAGGSPSLGVHRVMLPTLTAPLQGTPGITVTPLMPLLLPHTVKQGRAWGALARSSVERLRLACAKVLVGGRVLTAGVGSSVGSAPPGVWGRSPWACRAHAGSTAQGTAGSPGSGHPAGPCLTAVGGQETASARVGVPARSTDAACAGLAWPERKGGLACGSLSHRRAVAVRREAPARLPL